MSLFKSCRILKRALPGQRMFRTSANNRAVNPEAIAKLKKLQSICQKEDGKPIFLKLPGDAILFKTTIGLCVLGVLNGLVLLISHALPASMKG